MSNVTMQNVWVRYTGRIFLDFPLSELHSGCRSIFLGYPLLR